jgi:hypothetical protein
MRLHARHVTLFGKAACPHHADPYASLTHWLPLTRWFMTSGYLLDDPIHVAPRFPHDVRRSTSGQRAMRPVALEGRERGSAVEGRGQPSERGLVATSQKMLRRATVDGPGRTRLEDAMIVGLPALNAVLVCACLQDHFVEIGHR